MEPNAPRTVNNAEVICILPPRDRFPARAVYTPPFRSRGMTGNRLLPHTVYKGGKNSTWTVGFHLKSIIQDSVDLSNKLGTKGAVRKVCRCEPVTDVTGVAAPRLDGNSLVLRPRCLKIRGIATPACALVRNDRAFSNSPFVMELLSRRRRSAGSLRRWRSRSRRPRWGPWRASAGSWRGWPSGLPCWKHGQP